MKEHFRKLATQVRQRASNVDLASLSPGHTSAHSAISVLRCLQDV